MDHWDGRDHRRGHVDRIASMSNSEGKPNELEPTEAQLAEMSRADLVQLGGRMDGVETILKEPRWQVEGTKAEKRAERAVAYWLLFGGLSGLALL